MGGGKSGSVQAGLVSPPGAEDDVLEDEDAFGDDGAAATEEDPNSAGTKKGFGGPQKTMGMRRKDNGV